MLRLSLKWNFCQKRLGLLLTNYILNKISYIFKKQNKKNGKINRFSTIKREVFD